MIPFSNYSVEEKFHTYSDEVRPSMLALRDLVFTTAQNLGTGNHLEETLKWGQPSYLCKNGSTLRMDWTEEDPQHYRLFFRNYSGLKKIKNKACTFLNTCFTIICEAN